MGFSASQTARLLSRAAWLIFWLQLCPLPLNEPRLKVHIIPYFFLDGFSFSPCFSMVLSTLSWFSMILLLLPPFLFLVYCSLLLYSSLKNLFLLFLIICGCVLPCGHVQVMNIGVCRGQQSGSLELELQQLWAAWPGYWESNSGPLKEQQVLLTTEPSPIYPIFIHEAAQKRHLI